jgi:hypothetical protein
MSNIFRYLLGSIGGSVGIGSTIDSSSTDGIWIEPDSYICDEIVGYFGRTIDKYLISQAIIDRYGTGFRIEKDASTGITIQSYEKVGFKERLYSRQIEVISVNLGIKIVNAYATLFSEQTQNFSLISPTNVDTSEVMEYLYKMRCEEQYQSNLVSADIRSVQCGSSLMFTEFVDGRLKHRVLPPGRVKIFFKNAIEVDGKPQATDYTKIDDASCFILNTGSIDGINNRYVAIYGRSDQYKLGRYVIYTSDSDGKDVPDVGSDNAIDWMINGEVANPLSWYASQHSDMEIPEYPVSIFYGGTVNDDDSILPMSNSLMLDSLECDIAASHIRGAAAKCAEGTRVFTKSDKGSGSTIPKSLHGNVILEYGQKLEDLSTDIEAVEKSWKTLKDQMVSIASAYLVPDFMISSEDHTVEASSGIALKVRNKPLLKIRNSRIKKNSPSVYRMFEIDKALIAISGDGEERIINLLTQCEQKWQAGDIIDPENAVEKSTVITRLYELGLIDTVEALRRENNLGSEDDAIKLYEKIKRRSEEYPPLISSEE